MKSYSLEYYYLGTTAMLVGLISSLDFDFLVRVPTVPAMKFCSLRNFVRRVGFATKWCRVFLVVIFETDRVISLALRFWGLALLRGGTIFLVFGMLLFSYLSFPCHLLMTESLDLLLLNCLRMSAQSVVPYLRMILASSWSSFSVHFCSIIPQLLKIL